MADRRELVLTSARLFLRFVHIDVFCTFLIFLCFTFISINLFSEERT